MDPMHNLFLGVALHRPNERAEQIMNAVLFFSKISFLQYVASFVLPPLGALRGSLHEILRPIPNSPAPLETHAIFVQELVLDIFHLRTTKAKAFNLMLRTAEHGKDRKDLTEGIRKFRLLGKPKIS